MFFVLNRELKTVNRQLRRQPLFAKLGQFLFNTLRFCLQIGEVLFQFGDALCLGPVAAAEFAIVATAGMTATATTFITAALLMAMVVTVLVFMSVPMSVTVSMPMSMFFIAAHNYVSFPFMIVKSFSLYGLNISTMAFRVNYEPNNQSAPQLVLIA